VVFRVAGIIDLQSVLTITEPFVTVAGQSAPGDGVCLRHYGISVQTHDAVLRFLRVRPGAGAGKEVDGIAIGGNSHHVVVDHCSTTWAVDEQLSPSGAISDVTVQWSLIGEALNRSVHGKGAHGYGSLVRAAGGVSLHHNLWAHNAARNPRLGDNYGRPPFPVFDVRNNVMYDFGGVCSGLTGDRLSANYVANYIRPGPSSNRQRGVVVLTDTADVEYFASGNIAEHVPAATRDNRRLFERLEHQGRRLVTLVEQPFPAPSVRTLPALEALDAVLAEAGACRPVRDAVDRRIVEQARTSTGRIIDSPEEVGGWPTYSSGNPPADSDGDGMPDAWEKAHGLNPRNPADAGAAAASGYTHIEDYLNSLAASPAQRRR
jgi:hypothetical protein